MKFKTNKGYNEIANETRTVTFVAARRATVTLLSGNEPAQISEDLIIIELQAACERPVVSNK
jgi:hypothetical protein